MKRLKNISPAEYFESNLCLKKNLIYEQVYAIQTKANFNSKNKKKNMKISSDTVIIFRLLLTNLTTLTNISSFNTICFKKYCKHTVVWFGFEMATSLNKITSVKNYISFKSTKF